MKFDDLWARSASEALASLDGHVRDQAEALVREVCRNPFGAGTAEMAGVPRVRLADSGRVRVVFQVDEVGELVYVVDVVWRG